MPRAQCAPCNEWARPSEESLRHVVASSLKLRRSGARRGVGHELSFARAKVPAREKPVARERSKKRRPRKVCANDITLFVLSRNRFPLSFFWRIGERGSAGSAQRRGRGARAPTPCAQSPKASPPFQVRRAESCAPSASQPWRTNLPTSRERASRASSDITCANARLRCVLP